MVVSNKHLLALILIFDCYLLYTKPLSDPILLLAIVVTLFEIVITLISSINNNYKNPAEVQKEMNRGLLKKDAINELPVFEINVGDKKTERNVVEISEFFSTIFHTDVYEIIIKSETEYWIRYNKNYPEISYKLLRTIKEFFGSEDVIMNTEGGYVKIKLKW